jgi:branched-chain amino acid transport system substrate-binding protein
MKVSVGVSVKSEAVGAGKSRLNGVGPEVRQSPNGTPAGRFGTARRAALGLAALWLCLFLFTPAPRAGGKGPVVVGLNADMSTADAESGEAIRLGALAAIHEINSSGGVLGRPLALEVRDHRRNPARGIENVRELAGIEDVAAILGGKHTPVILAEIPVIHRLGIPYLVPWAAGTPIVDNGREPNYVFRVSVRDEIAGGFLARFVKEAGYKSPGLFLEQTGWGRSNRDALTAMLEKEGLGKVRVEWFNWGGPDHDDALDRLARAGADVVIFVGNSPDGVTMVRSMVARPEDERLPVISHWGIAGGEFVEPLGDDLALVDLLFLQTFSFFDPPFPDRAVKMFQSCREIDPGLRDVRDIRAPTGVAHAYDLVHLLARAVKKAGKTDRAAVRDALERTGRHKGVVRDYDPPFTPERHDALTCDDFRMAMFEDGVIIPVEKGSSH